jgi:hypothetical protein
MKKNKTTIYCNISMPASTMEALKQYAESVGLTTPQAHRMLLKQALDANMAINGLDELIKLIKLQDTPEAQKIRKENEDKFDRTFAETEKSLQETQAMIDKIKNKKTD